MKLISEKIYLTIQEVVDCGIATDPYLRKAKSAGTACWDFIDDPKDKRKVLVGYEAMTEARKKLVHERFGNPYELVAKEPILALLAPDFKAAEFYKQYRYGQGLYLPINRVTQYSRAASWLNLVNAVIADKKMPQTKLGLRVTEFYTHAEDLIKLEKQRGKVVDYTGTDMLPGDFPASYQRLTDEAKAYKAEGYQRLISHMFANKNSAKIGKVNSAMVLAPETTDSEAASYLAVTGKEVIVSTETQNRKGGFTQERYEDQMAVIRACATKHNNFDAETVKNFANIVFRKNGWETVSVATVRRILSENKHLLTPGRQGKRTYENRIAMQTKRKAPDYPLDYWTQDSWTVELSYRIPGPKGGSKFGRLVVCVVLDAFNKYPVGYAVGDIEDTNLIRQANRNAIIHMQELLGDYYRPWQMQSDNFQIKNLTEFYAAMTKLHTPAQVGNAKAKVIEPYFMYLNKQYCQKMANWTGFNLDAIRDNQVNSEMADQIKHTFPEKAGVMAQIDMIMDYERKQKRTEFLGKWEELPAEEKVTMSDVSWIEVFGTLLGDRTVKITGQGLMKTINGEQYVWDSFDADFRANRHIDWQIFADTNDYSKALAVSPDGKKKFLLMEKRVLPMDARSMSQADWDYLTATNEFNRVNRQAITEMYGDDADRMEAIVKSTPLQLDDRDELALKMMFISNGQQKDGIQAAKGLKAGANTRLPEPITDLPNDERKVASAKGLAMTNVGESDGWEERQMAFRRERVDLNMYAQD